MHRLQVIIVIGLIMLPLTTPPYAKEKNRRIDLLYTPEFKTSIITRSDKSSFTGWGNLSLNFDYIYFDGFLEVEQLIRGGNSTYFELETIFLGGAFLRKINKEDRKILGIGLNFELNLQGWRWTNTLPSITIDYEDLAFNFGYQYHRRKGMATAIYIGLGVGFSHLGIPSYGYLAEKYPGSWWGFLFGIHWRIYKRLTSYFSLRTIGDLELGDMAGGYADFKIGVYMEWNFPKLKDLYLRIGIQWKMRYLDELLYYGYANQRLKFTFDTKEPGLFGFVIG